MAASKPVNTKTEREIITGYKMANDGVDYTIVFPDALVSVVILLGWAGCRDKHLAKYRSIYNEHVGFKLLVVSLFELSNTALKLLEILYDYEVENSPIFFHVFSNGGIHALPLHFFLPRVVLYPVTKYTHKNHYDAIWESPPTWPQLYLYSRADRVTRYSDVDLMVKTPAHVSHFRDFPEEYSKRCLAVFRRDPPKTRYLSQH
uniref:Transmembrane protein 53 n=1 Tax=Oncorhynchus tshawytscha TaxID=74940 RepID=A0A8C8GAK7_ONCTS